MTIIEDTRQQKDKHKIENAQLEQLGVKLLRSKLPVGDYAVINNLSVVVDSKKDLQEVISNVCGKQHERFRNECLLAQENNIKLIILIEHGKGIASIENVSNWKNPRLHIMKSIVIGKNALGKPIRKQVQKYPSATTGETLAKVMNTMHEKYGVVWKFCTREEAGARIIELLSR